MNLSNSRLASSVVGVGVQQAVVDVFSVSDATAKEPQQPAVEIETGSDTVSIDGEQQPD